MYKFSIVASLVVIVNLLPGSIEQALANNLRIAVAANFYPTLKLITSQYQEQTQQRIEIIKGSTGKLYAQIKHGAPYDVFMAADSRRPEQLEQDGRVIRGSRQTYAIGRLAVIVSSQTTISDKQTIPTLVTQDRVKHIAIANPKIAPYGSAALELLRRLNVLKLIEHKLVYGENVAQAFQFVQSGSAECGIVALSQVKANSDRYLPVTVPNNDYVLEQQLVILNRSKHESMAQRFVKYLMSNNVQQLIHQHGYGIL